MALADVPLAFGFREDQLRLLPSLVLPAGTDPGQMELSSTRGSDDPLVPGVVVYDSQPVHFYTIVNESTAFTSTPCFNVPGITP